MTADSARRPVPDPQLAGAQHALSFDMEAVHVMEREGGDWVWRGAARFDSPDLTARLAMLRRGIDGLDGTGPARIALIIPDDQVLFTEFAVDPALPRRAAVAAGLDGLTPYVVEDLAFDWMDDAPDRVRVAAVWRETLLEAEAFATAHGFLPVATLADAEGAHFPRQVQFTRAGATVPKTPAPKADRAPRLPEIQSRAPLDETLTRIRELAQFTRSVNAPDLDLESYLNCLDKVSGDVSHVASDGSDAAAGHDDATDASLQSDEVTSADADVPLQLGGAPDPDDGKAPDIAALTGVQAEAPPAPDAQDPVAADDPPPISGHEAAPDASAVADTLRPTPAAPDTLPIGPPRSGNDLGAAPEAPLSADVAPLAADAPEASLVADITGPAARQETAPEAPLADRTGPAGAMPLVAPLRTVTAKGDDGWKARMGQMRAGMRQAAGKVRRMAVTSAAGTPVAATPVAAIATVPMITATQPDEAARVALAPPQAPTHDHDHGPEIGATDIRARAFHDRVRQARTDDAPTLPPAPCATRKDAARLTPGQRDFYLMLAVLVLGLLAVLLVVPQTRVPTPDAATQTRTLETPPAVPPASADASLAPASVAPATPANDAGREADRATSPLTDALSVAGPPAALNAAPPTGGQPAPAPAGQPVSSTPQSPAGSEMPAAATSADPTATAPAPAAPVPAASTSDVPASTVPAPDAPPSVGPTPTAPAPAAPAPTAPTAPTAPAAPAAPAAETPDAAPTATSPSAATAAPASRAAIDAAVAGAMTQTPARKPPTARAPDTRKAPSAPARPAAGDASPRVPRDPLPFNRATEAEPAPVGSRRPPDRPARANAAPTAAPAPAPVPATAVPAPKLAPAPAPRPRNRPDVDTEAAPSATTPSAATPPPVTRARPPERQGALVPALPAPLRIAALDGQSAAPDWLARVLADAPAAPSRSAMRIGIANDHALEIGRTGGPRTAQARPPARTDAPLLPPARAKTKAKATSKPSPATSVDAALAEAGAEPAPSKPAKGAAPGGRPGRRPADSGGTDKAVEDAIAAAIEQSPATPGGVALTSLKSSPFPERARRGGGKSAPAAPERDDAGDDAAALAVAAAAAARPSATASPDPAPQTPPETAPAGDAAEAARRAERLRLDDELQRQAEQRIRARATADARVEAQQRAAAEARARAQAQAEASAAAARGQRVNPTEGDNEPDVAAPVGGGTTAAGVANNATLRGMDLNRTTLIGVIGAGPASRGLIRLRNGKIVTVRLGDRIDGGPITSIGKGAVTYVKAGRAYQLRMLDGR